MVLGRGRRSDDGPSRVVRQGDKYLLTAVVVGDGDRETNSAPSRFDTWVGTGIMSFDDGRSPALAEGEALIEEQLARPPRTT